MAFFKCNSRVWGFRFGIERVAPGVWTERLGGLGLGSCTPHVRDSLGGVVRFSFWSHLVLPKHQRLKVVTV